MRKYFAALTIVSALLSTPALAHGPQIQTTRDQSGKIITRRIVSDSHYDSPLSAPTSVYVMPLGRVAGIWRAQPNPDYAGWPGFAYGHGYDAVNNPAPFPIGSYFNLGFTDGLKSWNGAAFVDAGVTQAEAYRGPSNFPTAVARTSDASPYQSLSFPSSPGVVFSGMNPKDTHSSMHYRMLGDGSSITSSLADGIYLLSMQLTNTNPSVLASDEFHFVLYKGATSSAVDAAVASLGFAPNLVQAIPEPATGLLASLGLACIAVRRRRR